MTFTGHAEDRLMIRELIDAYADAVADQGGWAMGVPEPEFQEYP